MIDDLHRHRTGMTFGIFFACLHALWAIALKISPDGFQSFLDWMFGVHFLKPIYVLTPYNTVKAVALIIITFASGYVLGWSFALLWNLYGRRLRSLP